MAKEVTPQRPYDKFLAYLLERAEVTGNEDVNVEDLNAAQADKILTATSEEELFAAMSLAGLTGLRDLDNGTVFTVNGYRVIEGTMGIGVYVIIDGTDPETGADVAYDTGVVRVISFLRMAEVLGLLPVTVQLVKKTTGSGGEMITLKRAPRQAVKSAAE